MQKKQNEKWSELNIMDQEDPQSVKEQSIRFSIIINMNYKKANL